MNPGITCGPRPWPQRQGDPHDLCCLAPEEGLGGPGCHPPLASPPPRGWLTPHGLCHRQEPLSPGSVTVAALAPDLRPLLLWMANAVELLYFTQQRCPLYTQGLEDQDVSGGLGSPLQQHRGQGV